MQGLLHIVHPEKTNLFHPLLKVLDAIRKLYIALTCSLRPCLVLERDFLSLNKTWKND